MQTGKVKKGRIKHSDIVKSVVALFALGKNDYADIEQFRNDAFFRDCLQLSQVASEATLRQRLDILAQIEDILEIVRSGNMEMLKKVADYGTEQTEYGEYIPLDIDVSPLDNSGSVKEGVSWTYKNHDGYAPIFAYLGTHGYTLNCELRPGSQHSNKGALEFIQQTLDMLEKLGVDLSKILVRLDSAHDCGKIIQELMARGVNYLIKRNLRHEYKEWWLAQARRVGDSSTPREGKQIFTEEVSHIYPPKCESTAPIFATFEVTERTIDHNGQELLLPEIEVNTFWGNLTEEAEAVIRLYHLHGTSEQYHSEYKTDLGVERLPSGKFATNSLLLLLAMLAFNALRILDQSALKMKKALPRKFNVQRRRLKSVMLDLIYIACKRVRHSGYIFLKFGRHCPWLEVFRQLHIKFC